MSGPLAGVRILDLSSVVMGPYATQLLGDYGADVIKIESPDGDIMRLSGPMRNPGMGHLYLNSNRNKRSVVIDLKTVAGRDVLLNLAKNADALVYNIRPQTMVRLGLGYEDVCAANPSIVYVGAFGFSQRGPYASRPAYDDLIQGMSGIPWLVKQAGAAEPRYAPMILADRTVGLQLALAITSALFHRQRTGRGQRVDVPMFEGMLSVVLGEHLAGKCFDPPEGVEGYKRSLTRGRRPYRTKDGYICTLIYVDKHWRNFFEAIGEPEMFQSDARFASQGARLEHIDEVYEYLSEVISRRSTQEWVDLLGRADIPVARMYSIDDILGDEHLAAIGYFQKSEHPSEGSITTLAIPTEWSDSLPEAPRHAPKLGENTVDVLREAGYTLAAIHALVEQGAVKVA